MKRTILILIALLILPSCAGIGEASGIKVPVELFTEVGEIASAGAGYDADGNGIVENEEIDSYLHGLFLKLVARFGTLEFGQPRPATTTPPEGT